MSARIYRVDVGRPAQKSLKRIRKGDREAFGRLWEHIRSLASDPRPHGCEKLEGSARLRIRVGDYRILYRVEDQQATVTVSAVGHRREIYR